MESNSDRHSSQRKKNILVLLWSSAIASGRDFLAGFASEARQRKNWQLCLRIAKDVSETALLKTASRGGFDGIVTNEDTYLDFPDLAKSPTTSVVVFGTYDPEAPATHLIATALDFIRKNATKPLRVADVVKHLGVSRSLVDLRFREFQGETVNETILRLRLEEVKKRLLSTNMSASKVAKACGFTDIPHLQVVFKKRFGLPMGQWRQKHSNEIRDEGRPTSRTKRRRQRV